MRIGVTGHMYLTAQTERLVVRPLHATLMPHAQGDLTGVSCLAPGADTLFARVILDLGGRLEVIQPSADYRTVLGADNMAVFDALLRAAESVRVLDGHSAGPEAYVAANEVLLSSCDRLVAVWDGAEAVDGGGTAAVVAEAQRRAIPTTRVWPAGAERLEK